MAETSYLTAEGLEKIKKELNELKTTGREELSKRLRAAIEMGDLSENADYIQAKEEQGFLEGRIQELEQILHNVVIIEEKSKSSDKVDIGSTVTVQESTFPEESYFLVGPKEADPVNGRISYASPIGKALIGHKVGDKVVVDTPNGKIHLKIIKVD
jgi:transcription elongation factor GreA